MLYRSARAAAVAAAGGRGAVGDPAPEDVTVARILCSGGHGPAAYRSRRARERAPTPGRGAAGEAGEWGGRPRLRSQSYLRSRRNRVPRVTRAMTCRSHVITLITSISDVHFHARARRRACAPRRGAAARREHARSFSTTTAMAASRSTARSWASRRGSARSKAASSPAATTASRALAASSAARAIVTSYE